MSYRENKQRAIYRNTEPTLTDQSQANDTDINVIVKKYGALGTVPVPPGEAMYGDFTKIPTDLRAMIEESRMLDNYRAKLPPQLKDMSVDELMELTPQKLTTILTPPPAPTPAPEPKKDEPKP